MELLAGVALSDYLGRALLAAALIGALCGLVGGFVVLRRRTFFAQALTHASYPGAVIAAALGVSISLGAALSALAFTGAMYALARIRSQGPNAAAGIVLTAGFALGALLQATIPGLTVRAETFLVGSILTVSDQDLILVAIVMLLAAGLALVGYRRFTFATFDSRGARAAGFREGSIEIMILLLTTLAVVSALPAVGAILAIAVIAAPAAAVKIFAVRSARLVLLFSALLGSVSGVLGVLLSHVLSVPAGPAITLCAGGFFGLALVARALRRLRWNKPPVLVQTAEKADTE